MSRVILLAVVAIAVVLIAPLKGYSGKLSVKPDSFQPKGIRDELKELTEGRIDELRESGEDIIDEARNQADELRFRRERDNLDDAENDFQRMRQRQRRER